MINNSKIYLLTVTIVLLTGSVSAFFPSMTPSSLDIENVEPGETVETTMYLYEDLGPNETVRLDIQPSEISTNALFNGGYSDKEKISEQRIQDWWEFEITELNNENEFSPEGSDEVFNGKIEAILDVPETAEPGLRYGQISVDPEIEVEGEGSSGGQVGFAFSPDLPYTVQIIGEARRDIVVQDVRGFRLDEDEAAVEILLRNTGTVTTSVQEFEIDIIDSSRNQQETLTANGNALEPGETRWFNTNWRSDRSIEEGSYEVDGDVDYFTGQAYASGSFSLPSFDVIEVRPEDSPAVDSEDDSLPIWLVLMVLVVLGVLMWSFEIDPFWIFGIVGVLGISAFVLMSNVSNLLLVGVLIPVLLIVYLGV